MYLLCITHFDVSLTVHLSIIFVIDQLNAQSARSTKHKNYTYEFIYVVASKSSRNHFIYEKYKMVESFKLHFHQNTSVVQLYLPTTVKMLQRFLEAILWNPFQLVRRILNDVTSITKAPSVHLWFQLREQVKISWSQLNHCAFMTIFLLEWEMFQTKFVEKIKTHYKSYCSTVHFRRITSIYQPTNAHIISHKTHLKHFKTLRHVSILSNHHQGALFLAKDILQYSQFNSYLQTRCCGSISCRVGMCCGAVV